LVVTADVLAFVSAGMIVAVDGVVGGTPGPKQIVYGAPGVGQVRVAYVAGVPTLTFNAADAITSARVIMPSTAGTNWSASQVVAAHTLVLPAAGVVLAVDGVAGLTAGPKQIVYGAPGAGQVRVVYTAGVATLTFNAGEAITAARVITVPTVVPTIKTIKG
jgi:hypothetical protein